MNWEHIEHFTAAENWGEASRVNGALILLLDKIRDLLNYGIVIHNAYERGGHSENSQHYLGNAVDFHVEGMQFITAYRRIEEILAALGVSNHVGFGVYPNWNTPGFHLDVRGTKARWGAVSTDGKQSYTTIEDALRKAGIA